MSSGDGDAPAISSMAPHFSRAIDNVVRHGDTDIFPFPIENQILKDKKSAVSSLLCEAYSRFEETFLSRPPSHIHVLAPAGHTGFRWASQQDPFWNAFLLGVTISLSSDLETTRIPIDKNIVFSYRFDAAALDGALFKQGVGWRDFIQNSHDLASSHRFVVICDISDCYQRIPHHRLENALRLVDEHGVSPRYIMRILGNYSEGRSYSLPVGGPAARILVEAVLNLSDRILRSHRTTFTRFADDYHIFVNDVNEAYEKLRFLSEKLARNDGLSLQKSKTRIMTSAEFIAAQTFLIVPDEQDINNDVRHLFALNLRYDPYSDTAEEDYATLKQELHQIDILGILNRELAKTRVHGAVTKKLIQAVKHLDVAEKEGAILTLVENLNLLYPIFPVVAITVKACFSEVSVATRDEICKVVRDRILCGDFLFSTELYAAYAIRILSEQNSPENVDAIVHLHGKFTSPLVRRDVILALAKWDEFSWLSDQINEYQNVSPWEKRAFIIASFKMRDAGRFWRERMKRSFNPFEIIVRDWAAERAQGPGSSIPL